MKRVWSCAPLLLALSALLWSSNFVVARALQGEVSPIDLAFWRWLAAFGVMTWVARRHLRRDLGELRRHWVSLTLLAAVGIAAMNTMVYRGLRSTTALNALLLQSTAPLLVLVCALAFHGERPRPRQVAAVLISMAGVVTIAAHGTLAAGWQTLAFGSGDLWIVAGTLCYALYTTMLRWRPVVHPATFLAATFALGAAMLLPFEAGEHLPRAVLLPGSVAVLAVLYLAVLPSVVAFLCFNRGVELIGAGHAGQYLHLMPVFGSALAIVFLGEALRPYHGIGAAAIAGGLLLAERRSRTAIMARPSLEWVMWLWEQKTFWTRRATERRELRCADARTWRDLGPARASDEADKPFWYR